MLKIFLSHNSKDKEQVISIMDELNREHDFDLVLDKKRILGGDEWREWLLNQLATCDVFLYFFGESKEGPWHKEERKIFERRRKKEVRNLRLIPITLPNTSDKTVDKLPKSLKKYHWLRFKNTVNEEGTLNDIIKAIKGTDGEYEQRILEKQLERAAQIWIIKKHKKTALLGAGDMLSDAERWLKSQPKKIDKVTSSFIEASIRARNKTISDDLVKEARFSFQEWQNQSEPDSIRKAFLYALDAQSLTPPQNRISEKQPIFSSLLSVPAHKLISERFSTAPLGSQVLVVAYSPDGKSIATGLFNGTIMIWEASTGKIKTTLKFHSTSITALAYSPDSETLASAAGYRMIRQGCNENVIKLLNINFEKVIHNLGGHEKLINALDYSPDGKTIISGSFDSTVRVWNAQTGVELKALKEVAVKKSNIYKQGILEPSSSFEGEIHSLVYSPNGLVIATGSSDYDIRLWDSQTYAALNTLSGHKGLVTALAYSPDGRTIVSASNDKTIIIWNADTGEIIHTVDGYSEIVTTLSYSQDGKTIASASGGTIASDGQIRILDATNGALLTILSGHSKGINSITYSPDSKVIISGSDDETLRWWDVKIDRTEHCLQGHTDKILAVAFDPAGKGITSYSSDNTIRYWNLEKGTHEIIHSWSHNTFQGYNPSVIAIAYRQNGNMIFSSSNQSLYNDASINIWSEDNHLNRKLSSHSNRVTAQAYNPNGTLLLAGSQSDLRIWDVDSGTTLKTLKVPDGDIDALALSPDSRLIAAASSLADYSFMGSPPPAKTESTFLLLDSDSGECKATMKENTDRITSLAFSPLGEVVASGSTDGTIRLWDKNTGKNLRTLIGKGQSISTLTYHPSGKIIASCSDNHTIQLWHLNSPAYRLLNEFDPAEASAAIKFLWKLESNELEYKSIDYSKEQITLNQIDPRQSILPEMKWHVNWTHKTKKFQPLLSMPRPEETKIDQVVRWLEETQSLSKNSNRDYLNLTTPTHYPFHP